MTSADLAMRSDYCGELTVDDVGRTVAVCGWVHRRREHGEHLAFVDLRDHTGLLQCVVDGAHDLRSEYVLRIVGTVRLWNITAGAERPALLLGPLAVEAKCCHRGIGAALVRHARQEAERLGHGAVLLVGHVPYYGRFGFSADKTGALRLPGPYERHRLLACELAPGTLDGAQGLIRATGAKVPLPFHPKVSKPIDLWLGA